MEKQVFKIVVTTSENNVQIVIDVDKEKFKQIIEPLILVGVKNLSGTGQPK